MQHESQKSRLWDAIEQNLGLAPVHPVVHTDQYRTKAATGYELSAAGSRMAEQHELAERCLMLQRTSESLDWVRGV